MPNHRSVCCYCKTAVLNRDIGTHILKKHSVELFSDKQNLRALHRDTNFKKPLQLFVGKDEAVFFCLADNSCIKNEVMADKHFKGRADAHKQAILSLREKYPSDGQTVDVPRPAPTGPVLTDKQKTIFQDFIMSCYASEDCEVQPDRRLKEIIKILGFTADMDELKELYPDHEAFNPKEEEEEEAPVVEEPVYEEPIVEEPIYEEPVIEEPVYVPPPPPPAPIKEAPVLPTPPPVTKSGPRLPNMTEEQTAKFMEFFPPDSKEFKHLFTSVGSGKFSGPPAEVAALMYKSASLQRQPEPTFGNLVQNTKLKKAQRVQKPLES